MTVNKVKILSNEKKETESNIQDFSGLIKEYIRNILSWFSMKNITLNNILLKPVLLKKVKELKHIKENSINIHQIINILKNNSDYKQSIKYKLIQKCNKNYILDDIIYIINDNKLSIIYKLKIIEWLESIKNWWEIQEIYNNNQINNKEKSAIINKFHWNIEYNDIKSIIQDKDIEIKSRVYLIRNIKWKINKDEIIEMSSNTFDANIFLNILKKIKTELTQKEILNIISKWKINIIIVRELVKNNLNYNFLKELEKYYIPITSILFNEKLKWSNISKQLIRNLEKNPSKNLYDMMENSTESVFNNITKWKNIYNKEEVEENWKRISTFQEKNTSKSNKEIVEKLNLNKNKLELSIYVRYWAQVDYPDIAEYIIMFLNKYINKWYSKYFSWIRIIPRESNKKPREEIINKENIEFYQVKWDDFKVGLHTYAIPLFLSHSTNSNIHGTPNIITSFMGKSRNKISKNNDTKSKIELEKQYNSPLENFNENSSLEKILKEIMQNIIDLEKELDKI